jgi:hypothetical protein
MLYASVLYYATGGNTINCVPLRILNARERDGNFLIYLPGEYAMSEAGSRPYVGRLAFL